MLILHAADLHLDSPLRDLPGYESAPLEEVRSATRRAFESLIAHCLDEDVSLLLLAGDLYDGDYRDHATALYLTDQLARLREVGTRVVWIRGNHDAESRITRHLRLPKNCHELRTAEPETRVFEDLGIAVHGQGYSRPDTTENLAAKYPRPLAGLFNIGLLHTALEGRTGHGNYAPCTAADLASLGYDYFALGHVHQREVVAGECPIVFPGNLQGRHVRETGEKGATVLRVEGGKLESFTHVPFDVVRWGHERIDASSLGNLDDVLHSGARAIEKARHATDGRTLALRLEFCGASRVHPTLLRRYEEVVAEMRRFAIESGGVYLEEVRVRTVESEKAFERKTGDAVSEMLRALEETKEDDEKKARLLALLVEEFHAVPTELRDEVFAEFERFLEETVAEIGAEFAPMEEDG